MMDNKSIDTTDLSDGAVFIEGCYLPITEAKVSMFDFGFTRSDTVYDVAHVWKGCFFRIEDHLTRFFRSMSIARMSIPYTSDEVREILIECVCHTKLRDAYVAMICTRGLPVKGNRDPRHCINRFYAYAIPYIWIATPEQRERGIHIFISTIPRTSRYSVDPTVKNYNWRDMSHGLLEAFDQGAETVVMLDSDNNVNEGPGFNIFVVTDSQVFTPESGVLEGITRLTVLELCDMINIPVTQKQISSEQLLNADEVFITSTAGGIMPVSRVNNNVVNDEIPGAITQRLTELYWSKHGPQWYGMPITYT